MRVYLMDLKIVIAMIAGCLAGVAALAGCQSRSVPIQIVDDRHAQTNRYSCIDLSEEDLQYGLGRVLSGLAQKVGPFETEALVKNYTPLIREGLYRSGFCRVQKLSINGVTVDLDIYFRTDESPAALYMEAYLGSNLEPALCLVNHYSINAY